MNEIVANPELEILAQLQTIKHESYHIQRLATALAKTDSSEATREVVADECQAALQADAMVIWLMQPRGFYEMIAERGCSKEFKDEWYRLYPEKIPLVARNIENDQLFIGSRDDFKKEFPNSDHLVEASPRQIIAYAPLVVNKKPIGLVGFSYNSFRDLPSKDFIMTLVHLSAQALERARLFELERLSREEAESANRAKTNFLSNMSHEIRAPISSIIGFADLIYSSQFLPATQRNWIWRILQNARHLSGLIGDVLDLSKIEANKIEVCKHVFSLDEFLEDVKAVTTFKAEEKSVWLQFHNPIAGFEICSDAIHLRQILINLIGNAIKFTPHHGQVNVHTSFENGWLRFKVRDSGIGIAVENQARIFEPFARVSEGPIGTGLGLSISKELAIALGGDLALEKSVLGQGSVFVVEIACNGFDSHSRKLTPVIASETHKLRGLRCLVVDDSVDNQIVVSCYLKDSGAEVETADNGKQGVTMAFSKDYDVVIMDIQMPELDGNRAVSQLRSRGYKKPIVALTAEVLAAQKQESLQRGFDEYLLKPINRDTLIETVARQAHNRQPGVLTPEVIKGA